MPYATSRLCAIQPLESRVLFASVPATFVDSGFGPSITDGTAMAFASDGRLFVLSKNGTVRIVSASGHVSVALKLAVDDYGERGLLGIAFSPAFYRDRRLFLYYTELPVGKTADYSGTTRNRVSRFTVNGSSIDPASEHPILYLDPVRAANNNGGGMAFGPDGKLYIGVGDGGNGKNAQDVTNRLGKLLRINGDGSIPSDNPTYINGTNVDLAGDNRAIYAAGLRNPFTLGVDPVTGTVLATTLGRTKQKKSTSRARA